MWEMICKKGTNESNLWSIVGRRHIHTRQMGSLKSIFRLDSTVGFMNFSDMYATPFFPGNLHGELKSQVLSSYDVGKWWGHP